MNSNDEQTPTLYIRINVQYSVSISDAMRMHTADISVNFGKTHSSTVLWLSDISGDVSWFDINHYMPYI